MLVSIIIPIYNVENYIEECLESVYQQTYPHIEVILVNDCTPDNSMQIANTIINKYKDKFPTTIVNHEQNKGLSEARNSGMRIAKGEYIYFIDGDDEIASYCIGLLAAIATKHNEIEFVEGQNTRNKEALNLKHSLNAVEIYKGNTSKAQILSCSYCWNILIKRSFIKEHSLSFLPNMIHEDKLFRYNIINHLSGYGRTKEITYFYKQHNYSITNTISQKHIESLIYLLSIIENYIHQEIDIKNYIINDFCNYSFIYWSHLWRKATFHRNYYNAFSTIIKSFIKKYFKDLNIRNILLLSPILFPYNISKHYVKIVWTIK